MIKELEEQMKESVRIDLACGQSKQPGFIGIDIAQVEGVDRVMDLEKFPWDIESESVDEVFCSHYIEHTSDMIKFMEELYRILKPGGTAKIIAPYYTSVRAMQDPTHKQFISAERFLYFNKNWRELNRLNHYLITCDFDFTYGYDWNVNWVNRSPESRQFALNHYWNVVNDIHVILTKK